jgi:excisionase family DNA binding protein
MRKLEPVPRLAYSLSEASAATSLSRRALEYLIEAGKLKRVKLGRRVVISAQELERLISNGVEESYVKLARAAKP